MRIGILTHPLTNNYGGILQNYALQTVIKSMGHEPITINQYSELPLIIKVLSFMKRFLLKSLGRKIPLRGWTTRKEELQISQNILQFVQQHIKITEEYKLTEIKKSKKYRFDAIIVGSDQVWRGDGEGVQHFFLSDFKDDCILKIAYAASMGVDWWTFTKSKTKTCKGLVQKFNSVSVRELSAVNLCKEYFNIDPQLVLDPTLLIDREIYINLTKNAYGKLQNSNSVMVYILDNDEAKQEIVENIANQLKCKTDSLMPKYKFQQVGSRGIEDCVFPRVEQWLKGIIEATYVVTDSFHGTVFSILFQKPFFCLLNNQRGSGRLSSLLLQLGLETRIVTEKNEIATKINETIDYEKVNSILNKKKKVSLDFLKNSLC